MSYNFDKSSLLNLKAELLRKQQETKNLKRIDPKPKPEESKNTLSTKVLEATTEEKPSPNSEAQAELEKSKKMLEKKAKLYDALVNKDIVLDKESSKRFLVEFDKKEPEPIPTVIEPIQNEIKEDENGDLIEYIDCFGRTRKCTKEEVNVLRKRDKALTSALDPEALKKIQENKKLSTNIDDASVEEESVSDAVKEAREFYKRLWEQQEEKLRDKSEVFYQDILFNEARSHGVGYYAFSTDPEERRRQQEELRKIRQETLQKQRELRRQRAEKLQEETNKKRAEEGLPALDISEFLEPEPEQTEELTRDEQIELEKQLFLREWDIGKKIFQEMTQEEWVEKKRSERQDEFAPPSFYFDSSTSTRVKKLKKHYQSDASSSSSFSEQGTSEAKQTLATTTHARFSSTLSEQSSLPNPIADEPAFQAKQSTSSQRKRKNYDELSTTEEQEATETSCEENAANEIPNPDCIEDSIMAGLRFLREQQEKKYYIERGKNFF